MPKIELFTPTEKQKLFLSDTHKYLGYGGARGGGKSFSVQLDAILNSIRYPGYVSIIVRRTYPDLIKNHIKRMRQLLKCDLPKDQRFATYNDRDKEIRFPNGSKIIFMYCDKERDMNRFQGIECDALYVDEATQHPEERVKMMNACVRAVNDYPKKFRYTFNPGGEGMAWVKRLFIDRQFQEGENPEEYAFIQSSVYDNKPLMRAQPDYIKQLEALPPRLRDMWLYGNWDVFVGQFFEDLRIAPDLMAAHDHGCDDAPELLRREQRWCHVIAPFDLNQGACRGWKILRSYDFGYGKPFSFGWWAIDYEGVMYRIHEFYGCTKTPNEGLRWTPHQQFAEAARIEREHPWLKGRKIDGVADPSIWDASRGESIAETAEKFGLYFEPGDNNRIAGWMQCHYRLQFDENGHSRMYVFDTCKAFIRTIPTLIYDEHRQEDLDTDLEDHVADEWRYAMMSRPIAPLMPREPKPVLLDPLDMGRKREGWHRRY